MIKKESHTVARPDLQTHTVDFRLDKAIQLAHTLAERLIAFCTVSVIKGFRAHGSLHTVPTNGCYINEMRHGYSVTLGLILKIVI